LIYPACDADRSTGPNRGRLYCAWTDLAPNGINTDIFTAFSDDQGSTWSARRSVTDLAGVDRFYPWLAVDARPAKRTFRFTTRATTLPGNASRPTFTLRGRPTESVSH